MILNKTFSVCDEALAAPIHICGFFDSKEQQYEVILPYILEGLEENDKVINILDGQGTANTANVCAAMGYPLAAKLAAGQLEVLDANKTYTLGGNFAAKRMYDMLEQTLISAYGAGYESVRACGDMSWALNNLPGTEELLKYESSLNQLTPQHSCSLICMYDVNSFSGDTLADILLTHPYVIVNGKLSKNAYYSDFNAFENGMGGDHNRSLKA